MVRKAKPIGLHVLDGKSRLTKQEVRERKANEIKPPIDNVECPDWLCSVAKKEWKRIQEDLINLGLLTNIDVNQLAIYCDAYAKYRKAASEIDKYGLVIKHTNKAGATNVVTNPYVLIAGKYADLIKKFCDEFGLTPSSRARLAIPQSKSNSSEDRISDLI